MNSNARLGLGFDGDCDRMAPMTKSGRLVKGDQLLTLFSKKIVEKILRSSVVFDVLVHLPSMTRSKSGEAIQSYLQQGLQK